MRQRRILPVQAASEAVELPCPWGAAVATPAVSVVGLPGVERPVAWRALVEPFAVGPVLAAGKPDVALLAGERFAQESDAAAVPWFRVGAV